MITLWRIFLASWKNLFRNAWISLATVFVFLLALLSVNVLLGVQAVVSQVVVALEDRVDIAVTFKPGTPQAVFDQAHFYLTSLPQVKELREVTSEQALKQFRELHAQDPKVLAALEELGGNPLGPQLVLKARHTDDYPTLLKAIQNPQYTTYVERQTYDTHEGAIALVQRVGDHVRLFASALIALFALFGLLIAFNAIRVAIYTQREEIAIMRLVGASSAFIRGPFLLEAVWLALGAFGLSVAFTYGLIVWSEPALRTLFDGQNPNLLQYFRQFSLQIVVFEGLGLVLLATLSSWLAVGRHIKR